MVAPFPMHFVVRMTFPIHVAVEEPVNLPNSNTSAARLQSAESPHFGVRTRCSGAVETGPDRSVGGHGVAWTSRRGYRRAIGSSGKGSW
jgi:hypothetical protein